MPKIFFAHIKGNCCREYMPKFFFADPRSKTRSISDARHALVDAFSRCQKLIEDDKTLNARTSGSTATMVVKMLYSEEMIVAHCGDSRVGK
jgi:serine/threonine protein phosphatase PrpC